MVDGETFFLLLLIIISFLLESWIITCSCGGCSRSVPEHKSAAVAVALVGWRGGGGGARQSGKEGCDVKERWDGGGALTFTLAPQLMLRCCHFHHLKCCHFRCWSLALAVGSGGREGKREEVWEHFHFKQAQLCHTASKLPLPPPSQGFTTSCFPSAAVTSHS